MFERYTEDARKVIFFARYEASNFGSSYIETEHLLLGMAREQAKLLASLTPAFPGYSQLSSEIAQVRPPGHKISTSVDLPLSNQCKRILAYAAEEAERLADHFIRSHHLLLGMLREENSLAADLLEKYGAEPGPLRQKIAETTPKAVSGEQGRTMYCGSCGKSRAPLICKHCSVAICLKCGSPLLESRA